MEVIGYKGEGCKTIKYENQCCDCAVPAYPCKESDCPLLRVPIYYCDYCGCNCNSLYDIEGEQYCEDCTKKYLKEVFEDLSVEEQAQILEVNMREV